MTTSPLRNVSPSTAELTERPGFPGSLLEFWGASAGAERLSESLAGAPARIPVPKASAREAWDQADPATVANIIARARKDLNGPWPQMRATEFARLRTADERARYEGQVFARHIRLNRAVVAAVASPDAAVRRLFLDEVIDGVMLFCEQSTWSWPAHDDSLATRGWVVPNPENPFLDLGAGDVLAQLGWIDHVLGEELDQHAPGVRSRIRQEAERRCFTPFLERKDFRWRRNRNNWIAWIPCNLIIGALTLLDDPHRRAEVVAEAITLLDEFLDTIGTDGAIDEGYVYWWRGPAMLLDALELLHHVSAGELSAIHIPKVGATARFPLKMQLDHHWYYNPADGRALPGNNQPWHLLHRWGNLLGDAEVSNHAASHRHPELDVAAEFGGDQKPAIHGMLGQLLMGLSDRRWTAAQTAPAPLPRDVWLPSVEIAIARETAGSAEGLTLAIKGGHNAESHNHNDVGSLVVAIDGRPMAVDVGCPQYDAKTFSAERYTLWMMQSSWHNTPEPRGVAQLATANAASGQFVFAPGTETTSVSMDLTAAYELHELQTLSRTASLNRVQKLVTVEDSWRFTAPGEPMAIHYVLAGNVTLDNQAGSAMVEVPQQDHRLLISWDPGLASATMERKDFADTSLNAVWGTHLTRLRLLATTKSAEGSIAVSFQAV